VRRTLVGFPDQDLSKLDAISAEQHVSRAELIRQAVSTYLEKFNPANADDNAFGLWRGKKVDGLAYQNQLREEW
jgi:metal-responsive CopG/Arc/MetJ family transcriptional regulator